MHSMLYYYYDVKSFTMISILIMSISFSNEIVILKLILYIHLTASVYECYEGMIMLTHSVNSI